MTRKMAASKSFQCEYQDRKYQFIDENNSKDFVCTVCLQLCFEVVQTSCGHLFCDKCLKKWISEKKEKRICPTCQTHFTKADSDKFNARQIKDLTVLCPNVSRGCEWKGELGSVEAHQKDHCAYELVQCPNKCGTKVERRELEEHKKDHCELREYECQYCKEVSKCHMQTVGYKSTFKDVTTKHFKECGGYPVDCPNKHKCGAQVLVREDLPSHLAACPEQVIPCRYQTMGCKVRLARKEMIGHLEDKDGHLVLAMGTTSDLVQQITTLQQQVSVLLKKSGVQLPSAPQHPAKPWLKVDPLPLYPPFTIKTNVSTKNVAISPPFMTHPGGYRLRVKIKLSVYNYASFYLSPVDCPENHSLKWPVTITIKAEVLNQEEDGDHIELSQVSTLRHSNDEQPDEFTTNKSMWPKAGATDQLFFRVISVDASL